MGTKRLGLALSGGGFRASFFHIGVLARLAELDLLRQIDVISTVSGGSIVGTLYYLHVKRLLETRPDEDIEPDDYVEIVRTLEHDVVLAVEKNLRMRTFANLFKNFRMFKKGYSRSDRIGELYTQFLYQPAVKQPNITMHDLKIQPVDGPDNFHPYHHNDGRRCKVPILVLNATTLNTGHTWQFTATWLGEPPSPFQAVDKNVRLRRLYYHEAPEERHRNFAVGAAVAASACVPGVFHPLPITSLYDGITVQLVDGGVHDNQGIMSLLDEKCTHIICSDASGQMGDVSEPKTNLLPALMRSNGILMDRVREEEVAASDMRLAANRLEAFVFLDLKKDIPSPEKTWIGGADKPDQITGIEGVTDYKVDCGVQNLLANLRTDLDSFTEVEAFSLMSSAYLMTGEYVDAHTARAFGASETPVKSAPWRFSQVEPFLRHPERSPRFVKQLQVGSQQAFKAFALVPALKWATIGGLIALAVSAFYYIWTHAAQLKATLGETFFVTLAFVALAVVLGAIPGVRSVEKARNLVFHLAKRLAIALLTFVAVWIDLLLIDPLFVRQGRLARLLAESRSEHTDKAA